MSDIEILVLAGGKATRFADKLQHPVGSVSMLRRVCDTFSSSYPTYISCSVGDRARMLESFNCTVVADRWPDRGPLGGMLTTMQAMRTPLTFAVAADMPFVDISLIRLLRLQHDGEEAAVPVHDDDGGVRRTFPLTALYDRAAFLREGTTVFLQGGAAVHSVLDRLQVRYVPLHDGWMLRNINTPADYRRYCFTQVDP